MSSAQKRVNLCLLTYLKVATGSKPTGISLRNTWFTWHKNHLVYYMIHNRHVTNTNNNNNNIKPVSRRIRNWRETVPSLHIKSGFKSHN